MNDPPARRSRPRILDAVHWPRERPVRTIIAFLGIALGAKIVHRVHFERGDHIPATGPAIIVANHISETETLALARLVTGHHRFPHFLTKAEVFSWPVVGWIMRSARQIPVIRGTARAGESLTAAAKTLQRGQVVCLYPAGNCSLLRFELFSAFCLTEFLIHQTNVGLRFFQRSLRVFSVLFVFHRVHRACNLCWCEDFLSSGS